MTPTGAGKKPAELVVHVLWTNAGLSCDGDSVSLTAAKQPSIENSWRGATVDDEAKGPIELFGTRTCPYTAEVREDLLWNGRDFIEYDVEADDEALARMLQLTGGQRTVPVIVQDGRVTQIGWQGLGCIAEGAAPRKD